MFKMKNNRRAVALVAGALALGVVGGCSKQQTPEQLLAEAKQFRQRGDNKAALIQLKNALAKEPANIEARALLGEAYLDMGDAASAEKEIRRALELGLDRQRGLPKLASALLLQNQGQKVLSETADPAAQALPDVLALRGNASLQLQKIDDAKAAFEAALKADPGQPEALLGMAQLALLKRDAAEATRLTALAVEKNPKNIQVWFFKAQLARAQGKPADAQAALDQLLAIKPDHADAHLQKAAMYISEKKFDAAKTEIAAAKKANPPYLLNNYTQALLDFTQGQYPAALDGLQKLLSKAPEHMPSVLLMGASQFALGSIPQAEQNLKKYLENVGGDAYARRMLATIYLSTGRPKDALAVLAPVLTGAPDTQALKLAGRGHMELREYVQAASYFDRASKIDPNSAELHVALGMSKLGLSDMSGAVAQMEEATRVDPKSVDAGIALAMTQLRLKQYDKAIATLQGLEREQPRSPMLQNLQGNMYLAQNKAPQARASFDKALEFQPSYFAALSSLVQMDLTENKPDAAKARLTAFLEKNKDSIEAMAGLAKLAEMQGQVAETRAWLERIHAANPKAVGPVIQLAGHYLAAKEVPKALTLVSNTQVAHPDSPELLDLLARIQLASQNKSGALESYNKLAILLPGSASVQYRLATVHIAMENYSAAVDGLKKAIKLQPNYLDAQVALVELEQRKGNTDSALTQARQLQQQKVSMIIGYALEGDIQQARNKPDLAAKAYASALEQSKEPAIVIKYAESLRRAGKAQEGIDKALAWRKAHPSDILVGIYLAENYLAAKKYALAIEELQRVLKVSPKNAAALNDLAWVYYTTSDARALATAEQAYQLAADSPAIMDTLGWILTEQGQAARGVTLLQKAVAVQPEAADTRFHLAAALVKSNDKAGARKELERLLANAKDFPNKEEAQALLKQL